MLIKEAPMRIYKDLGEWRWVCLPCAMEKLCPYWESAIRCMNTHVHRVNLNGWYHV